MKYKFVPKEIQYDGSQLRPLFAYTNFRLHGNSIISFIGGCDVTFAHMVDMEDLVESAEIKSNKMLHFIVEVFGTDLIFAVTFQRLMVSIAHQYFLKQNIQFTRDGDDLFLGQRKFSISIASQSVVSSMVHFAMNITNEGTPVETCSFEDIGVSANEFAEYFLPLVAKEFSSIVEATQKVKPL